MGVVIFGVMVLYLIASLVVVVVTARAARKKGRSPWRWGGAAALVMYLLVFWDHIPTVLVHKYYCEREAGFWIYKTFAQWTAENPGVVGSLKSESVPRSTRNGNMQNYTDTYYLNQRLGWVVSKSGPFLLNRWRHEQVLIDTNTGEKLARYVDFSTGYGYLGLGGDDWRIAKFWLVDRHCSNGERDQNKLRQFKNRFLEVGK